MIFYSRLSEGAFNVMNPESDVSKTCGNVAKALDFPPLLKRCHAEWVD